MAVFGTSLRAKRDLLEISNYTQQIWGEVQARRYLANFEHCFSLLAQSPHLGRSCSSIHPSLRRFEQGSHVVFYRETPEGVVISRVLHRNMLPAHQRFPA